MTRMLEGNIPGWHIYVLIGVLFWCVPVVPADGNVGCAISPDVCEDTEECFDDNVFGRCQLPLDLDQHRHHLSPEVIQLLERELERLFAGGYRWDNDYAQCVVQNILYSSRHQISYDPGLCSRLMQFTLPEIPSELISELQSPDPDELAFIKFKPNRDNPDSDVYADEIFTPPLFSEENAETNEKKISFPHGETSRKTTHRNKDVLDNKEQLLEELLKTAGDTETLLEELKPDSADRYPEENLPIFRTHLSSDLDQAPTFTEGGVQWMPLDKDSFSINEMTEPLDKKRVKVLSHHHHSQDSPPKNDIYVPQSRPEDMVIHVPQSRPEDMAIRVPQSRPEDMAIRVPQSRPEDMAIHVPQSKPEDMDIRVPQSKPPEDMDIRVPQSIPEDMEILKNVIRMPEKPQMILEKQNRHVFREASGRSGRQDEDTNFHWNSKHRTKNMDDDLMRFAKSGSRTNLKTKPDLAENNNLSDVVEHDSFEDQLYAILPGLPTFTSDKRYDIKKPGPTYMIHEDEDGVSNENDAMTMQGADNFIDQLSKNGWRDSNKMFTAPVDLAKNLSPFIHRYEATDEISRLYVTSGNGELERVPENKPEDPAVIRPVERLPADQPEMLEGIEPFSRDEDRTANAAKTGEGHIGRYDSVDATRTNIAVKEKDVTEENAQKLVKVLEKYLSLDRGSLSNIKVKGQEISFKVNPNSKGFNASEVAAKAEEFTSQLKDKTGLTVEDAGIGDKVKYEVLRPGHDRRLVIMTLSLCGAVAGLLLTAIAAFFLRRNSRFRDKLANVPRPDVEASQDYQDLCRQRMASKATEKAEPVHTVHSPKKNRSLSQEGQASTSSHSSTSSWNEEPVTSNMDISTGHMILSYMEDHLKNKDRLDREWEALCAYEAELCATNTAAIQQNIKKNRYTDVLPYDHSRVVLNEQSNVSGSDYINASSITDHDPRNPAYIATQGPLPLTGADFWQMIWEQGSVVIVMLSRLMENGVAMCHRYWPEEGSEVYHIYEVHLVSEHIWCDDYLVRSFYLKNLRTSETRTVTQFHFMSWPDNGVPNSTKALLEFRRKVNKSYRGRSCPIAVHCSDGIGRTGTYCLIDMVLNRMAKGAKEIDIAATLEHVRDQRAGMVKTKAQFEFVLMAIAEEVHAILKALSH